MIRRPARRGHPVGVLPHLLQAQHHRVQHPHLDLHDINEKESIKIELSEGVIENRMNETTEAVINGYDLGAETESVHVTVVADTIATLPDDIPLREIITRHATNRGIEIVIEVVANTKDYTNRQKTICAVIISNSS